MESTQRCPGNELNKTLNAYDVKCPSCGKVNEIFNDEVNKKNKCSGCGTELDTSQLAGG